MANVFLDENETFTLASSANVVGRDGGSEAILLQDGVTGVTLDGNVERLDVAGDAADTTFQVNAEGQLEVVVGGTVVGTFTGGLNQSVDVRMGDGNVTLNQTGASSWTVADPADDTDTATIDSGNSPSGDAVTLGSDVSAVAEEGPEFSVTDNGPVTEGNTATFTVSLSEVASEATTVDYAVGLAGGAAAADHGDITVDGSVDNSGSGTLSFAAGETSKTITIPVLQDLETPEDGEGISVTLSNPTGGADLGTASATADITNEFPYVLTQGQDSVEEGDSVTYTLTTVQPVSEETTVAFSVVPGDTEADDQGTNDTNLNDFDQGSFNPSEVTIAAGESTAEFTLTTQTDTITELPEDYTLQAEVNGETVTIETTLLDGSGFTLTGNNDSFSGDGNDDVFTSGLGTLDDADILEGLGGDDVLNARMSGVARTPTMDSVDTINIDARADTAEIGLDNASGTTAGSITGSSKGTISAADSGFTSFMVKGNDQDGAYDATATLEFVTDVFTGSEDELTLSVDNVSGATIVVGAAGSSGSNDLETFNVQSNGSSANSFTFTNGGTAALDAIDETVITGDADLTMTTAVANFDLDGATIDASGHNGDLDIVTDDTTAIDASDINGVDELTLTGDYNATISNLEDGAAVEVTADTTSVTIDQRGADVAGSLNDTLDVTLNPGADATQTVLTIDDVETVNLTSTTSADDPTTVTNTITDFAADALGTLNISGDAAVTFTNALTDQVDVIDANGLSAAVSGSVLDNNTAAVAFTGGTGDDTFTGSTFDDALTGGEGDDTLTGDQGADLYTLGAGSDDVVIGAADESGVANNARDLITDFALNEDEIDLSASGGTHTAVSVETAINDPVAAATIELVRGDFSSETDPSVSAFSVDAEGDDVLASLKFDASNATADVQIGLLGLGSQINDIDLDDFIIT